MKYKLLIFIILLLVGFAIYSFLPSLNINDGYEDEYSSGGVLKTENNSLPINVENGLMESLQAWQQNGSEVYFEDNKIYISATDKTNSPVINIMTKQFSGEVNIAFGFDTQDVKPKSVGYNKHYVNVTKSYTCKGDFEYVITPTKHFWCYTNITSEHDNDINETVVFDHYFESGDLEEKTAYWNEQVEEWNDVSGSFEKITFFLNNTDTWYYKKNFNMNANQKYELKLNLMPKHINTPATKYWIAIWPSDETIKEALLSNHFYALDPLSGDLNVDLVSYYKLDDQNDTVIDSLANFTMVNLQAQPEADGIINTSFEFNGSIGYLTGNLTGTYSTFAINVWANSSAIPNNWAGVFNAYDSGSVGQVHLRRRSGDAFSGIWLRTGVTLNAVFDDVDQVDIFDGAWHMLTGTYNGTMIEYYVDGVLRKSLPATGSTDAFNFTEVGRDNEDNARIWKGNIDELSVWSRGLNQTEVTQLWNGGAGITFEPPSPTSGTAPTVELVNPEAGFNKTGTGLTFPFNFTCNSTNAIGVLNLTLVFDGKDNVTITNTSVAQNMTFSQNITLPEGDYNYTCRGENEFGATTPSERFFNYTQKVITVIPLSPANDFSTSLPFAVTSSDVNAINLDIKNVTVILDGSNNQTNSSTFNGTYTFNLTGLDGGSHTWFYRAYDNNDVAWDGASRNIIISSINVILHSPDNDAIFKDGDTVQYNCTAFADEGVINVTLFIDGQSFGSLFNTSANQPFINLPATGGGGTEGQHNWTCSGSTQMDTFQASWRNYTKDETEPFINISSPEEVQGVLLDGQSLELNWTITDPNLDSCWFYYSIAPCYQESSNTTNQTGIDGTCSLDYDGTYQILSTWTGNGGDNLFDGDWDTASVSALVGSATLLVNYSKPDNNLDYATYHVKHGHSTGEEVLNITLNQSCFNQNPVQMRLKSHTSMIGEGFSNVTCWDGDDYIAVSQKPYDGTNSNVIFEEAITWESNRTDIADCTTNTTTFTYEAGRDSIIMFANDTAGNINSSVRSWIAKSSISDQGFHESVVEGSNNLYYITLEVSPSLSLSEADLIYNGTVNEATFSNVGNIYNVTIDFIAPSVSAVTNVSFLWQFTFNDTTMGNSTSNNQTITLLTVDDCSVNSILWINMTLVDEESQIPLNGSFYNTTVEVELQMFAANTTDRVLHFFNNYTEDNNPQICLEEDLGESNFDLFLLITYGGDSYASEVYNIFGQEVGNDSITTDITLFDLKSDDSTEFLITYKDESFIAIQNALILIQRKYVSEGVFKTVELPKTDQFGQAKGHFDTDKGIYTFTVIFDNEIIATFNEVTVICQDALLGDCDLNLNELGSNAVVSDWENFGGVSILPTFDESTRTVTTQFTSTSGAVVNMSITTIKFDRFENVTVCTDSLISASGIMSCSVPDSFGNISIISRIKIDGEVVTTQSYDINPSPQDNFGLGTYVMFLILLLTLPFMLASSTIGVMFGVIIGFLMAGMLMVFDNGSAFGETSSIIWLIVSSGIIIWKISQRE